MRQMQLKILSLLNTLVNVEAITPESSKAIARGYMENGDLDEVICGIYSSGFDVAKMSEIQDVTGKIEDMKERAAAEQR